MNSLTIDDGIHSNVELLMKDSFEYVNGVYYRNDKEFLGFGTVITHNINTDPAGNNSIYRSVIQTYDNSNSYSKENLLSTVVEDGNGNKYDEKSNEYYCYSVSRAVNGGQYTFQLGDLTSESMQTNPYIIYSPLKYTINKKYENGAQQSMTTSETFMTYYANSNGHGELEDYTYSDKGGLWDGGIDPPSNKFNYLTHIQYTDTKDPKNYYVYGLPSEVTVEGGDGVIYRRVLANWDTHFSDHITQVKNVIAPGDTATTDMSYDYWGNIKQKILPTNSTGQRMSYNYTYDPLYHMYPTRITDAFGYTSTLDNYNYKYGVPCRTTDENGNIMTTTLDNLGRVTQIKGPNESAYTLKFDYHPRITRKTDGSIDSLAYARTKHYDPSNPTDDLETYTFTDGLGRAIQVKKDGELWNGSSANKVMIVSGRVKYDAFGRVKEAYYPITEGTGTKTTFNTAFDGITSAKTTYDILDRVLTTTTPDGKVDSLKYSIESGNLKTTAVDAMGGIQATYTNGSGQTIKTVQYSGPNGTIITGFGYDAINQLLTVTDAMGNTTTSVYDMAGRRTQVTHPASGTTKFMYDPAGNLTGKQTANMLANNGIKKIQYIYNYNRLDSISYPDHKENNVKYIYGLSTDITGFNRVGRLVYQIDGSGGQEFKYGKMGEMTELRRTLMIPDQAVATYVTNWTYDCWDRIQNMTYPDGEKLTYTYNTAGLLTGLAGTKGSDTYTYVKNIGYDKFEQRASMQYGNGTGGNGAVTTYTYNPQTRLLSNLQVLANNTSIMNNGYTYDAVRNVTDVKNTGVPSANQLGGQIEHIYTYDGLYRLKTGTGTYAGSTGKTASYTLSMAYDNLHNITGKKQDILQNNVQFTGALNAGYKLSYNYAANSQQISNIADSSYRYAAGESQAPKIKTQDYGYDTNGNLVYVNTGQINTDKTFTKSNERKLLWDEENRLLALSDNGFVSNYWYDAAGDRTVKESGVGQGVSVNGLLSGGITGTTNFTAYISPYLVLNNGGFYTKHIYMGSQRIVSKLGSSDIFTIRNPLTDTTANKQNFVPKLNDLTAKIKVRYDSLGVMYKGTSQGSTGLITSPSGRIGGALLYYFHSDHLGSSSLITDATGGIVQHMEYIPFGEVFIDERAATSTWSTPYKFNAKELDEETGLYYYGARYYDPRTSVWISVDPLAEKYPGVNSYVYCLNNPVRLIDPDGKRPTPLEAAYIADHVYSGKGKLIGGWEMVNWKSHDSRFQASIEKISFQSAVYRRMKEDGNYEYVYATAGSSSGQDFVQNKKQLEGTSEQYQQSVLNAEILSTELGDKELTYDGHSLGGGLASANALKTGDPAITFNAAALSSKTKNNLGLNQKADIIAYIVSGEVVDYLQSMIGIKAEGTVKYLPASYIPNVPFTNADDVVRMGQRVNNHLMGTVIKKLKESGETK